MHEAPHLEDDGIRIAGPRRYALFGHPVERSLSPRIHAAFAEQTGVAMHYQAIQADAVTFAERLAQFEHDGGRGGNVTTPLKAVVASLCRQLGAAAQRSGVVNTLTRLPDGGFRGDNTDGEGFLRDLCQRHQHDIRARRVLLLGAGGAIAGILPVLLDAGVGEVMIVNRNPEAADALSLRIGEPERVHSRYWQDLPELGVFDLIVNGTSAGVRGESLKLPMNLAASRAIACDLNYGAAAGPFLAWARAADVATTLDGLGMLVDQAAAAFALWHGVEPDADAVYEALRAG